MLLFILTVSVTLRSDGDASHEVSNALHSYPWLECLAPLWALDLLYAGVAGYVAANACAGRFVMSPTQGLCFVLFVLALVGSTVAEILLLGDTRCVLCVGGTLVVLLCGFGLELFGGEWFGVEWFGVE